MPTTQHDIYLARLLDTRATFTISSNGASRTPRPSIDLYHPDPTILLWCHTHYSGHLDPRRRRWRLSTFASLINVIDRTLPHLTAKKHHAMTLHHFIRLCLSKPHHPYTPEVLTMLNSHRETLQFLNTFPSPSANLPPPP